MGGIRLTGIIGADVVVVAKDFSPLLTNMVRGNLAHLHVVSPR